MLSFLARRLLSSIPVVGAVLALCFLLVRIAPGSPFATERSLDPATQIMLEKKYGLSGTLPEQLFRYGSNVLRGDLGDSLKFRGRTVGEIIGQSLPRSLLLGSIAFTLALGLGIPLGAWAAAHHGKKTDSLLNSFALLTLSTPTFVLAPVSVLLFSFGLKLLPPAGWGTLSQLILPAICLAIPFVGVCARLTRGGLLETLGSDFIRTARAKGVSGKQAGLSPCPPTRDLTSRSLCRAARGEHSHRQPGYRGSFRHSRDRPVFRQRRHQSGCFSGFRGGAGLLPSSPFL